METKIIYKAECQYCGKFFTGITRKQIEFAIDNHMRYIHPTKEESCPIQEVQL